MFSDIILECRTLANKPLRAVIVISTLSLVMVIVTIANAVAEGILWRPLPYPNPDRLVYLTTRRLTTNNIYTWKQSLNSFSRFAALSRGVSDVRLPAGKRRINSIIVSEDFFPALGVRPYQGRPFVDSDFSFNSEATVIISSTLASREFGSPQAAIYKVIDCDDVVATIVGIEDEGDLVLPGGPVDLLLPLRNQRPRYSDAVARLKPEESFAKARQEVDALHSHIAPLVPGESDNVQLHRLGSVLIAESSQGLTILIAAALIVFLVACTNVSHVLLEGVVARWRDFEIRAALGASGFRIARLVITEAGMLFIASTVVGIFGAWSSLRVARELLGGMLSTAKDARVTLNVISLTGFALVFGVVVSSIPSLVCLRSMRGSVRMLPGPYRPRIRLKFAKAFILSEVAITMALTSSASLLVRSFLVINPEKPGFEYDRRITMRASVSLEDPTELNAFVRTAIDRVAALPGINAVAVVSELPFTGRGWVPDISVGDQVVAGRSKNFAIFVRVATPNYLPTMGVPLSVGRNLLPNDDERQVNVAIINQTASRQLFGSLNPMGHSFAINTATGWRQFYVVGVAKDARMAGTEAIPSPEIFLSIWQVASSDLSFVLQTTRQASDLTPSLSTTMHAVNGDVVVSDVRSMDSILREAVRPQRTQASLLTIMAIAALCLSILGIYGVTAFAVTQRFQEIAVRLAIGSTRRDILTMLLKTGLSTAGLGIILGIVGAGLALRMLSTAIYGVSPLNALSFAIAFLIVFPTAGIATIIPSVAAVRISPSLLLRSE